MNRTISLLAVALLLALPSFAAAQTQAQTQARTQQAGPRPLVIVDGIILGSADSTDVRALFDPAAVASIEVIKSAAAVKLYGERAEHGAVVVTLRRTEGAAATPPSVRAGVQINQGVIIREATAVTRTAPLYIVDGVVIAGDRMPELHPSLISNIEVIKGAEAARLYGTRAANGIVSITTKR